MRCLSTTQRTQVVASLLEGNSIRATVRMTGVCKDTVLKLLCDLGATCAAYHNRHVRNVKAQRVQCDEIWNFCYAKAKNVPEDKKALGAGDVWTWVGIEAQSKMVISYLVADRGPASAYKFMQDLAERVASRIQITTDGHRVYLNAVEDKVAHYRKFLKLDSRNASEENARA